MIRWKATSDVCMAIIGASIVFSCGTLAAQLTPIWTETTPAIYADPGIRWSAQLAYDSLRGVTVLHGGYLPSLGISVWDTWEWNGNQYDLQSADGPAGSILGYDAIRALTVKHDFTSGETYGWNGVNWQLLSENGPTFWGGKRNF